MSFALNTSAIVSLPWTGDFFAGRRWQSAFQGTVWAFLKKPTFQVQDSMHRISTFRSLKNSSFQILFPQVSYLYVSWACIHFREPWKLGSARTWACKNTSLVVQRVIHSQIRSSFFIFSPARGQQFLGPEFFAGLSRIIWQIAKQ